MKTVPLHGKLAAGRIALVDDEDYDLVMQYRWSATKEKRPWTVYPRTGWRENGRVRSTRMHNLIMGTLGIDHADGNGLNNQRSNLRIATPTQNLANTRPRPGASLYKGVHLDRVSQRWRAVIRINGKRINLGRFPDEIQAALAYDAAARELFGEFARPNFPEDTHHKVLEAPSRPCAREGCGNHVTGRRLYALYCSDRCNSAAASQRYRARQITENARRTS